MPQLVRTVGEPQLRATIMRRLLTAESESGLSPYLSLVRDDTIRLEALAVADDAPHLPISKLLSLLDDDDEAVPL